AAGNPLYLEQMVRIYHDTGVLEEEEDHLSETPRWKVHEDRLAAARLPLTIEDAVNARLAALAPDEKTLLEQAAAMGSVFWSGAFAALRRASKDAPDFWDPASEQDVAEVQAIRTE